MGNCQTLSATGEVRGISKGGSRPQILIKSYTWARDSHGLFDYESKNLTKKNLKTNHPGKIIRSGNDVRLGKENEKNTNKEEKDLLKLILKDGNVYVDNCNEIKEIQSDKSPETLGNLDLDLWLVIKSLKTHLHKGYKLMEGDIMKLGRVKFRIKELQGTTPKTAKCEKHTKIEEDNVSIEEAEKKSSETPKGSQASISQQTCRICLSESADASDPFFTPCHCTGTMKHIHVKCLQRWLKSKLHIKQTTGMTSIYWKTLECELCKTQYPTHFMVNGKRYDVVEIDRPECPFIILEILSKDKAVIRGMHVVKMENRNNIRLGRGHDSDIRITDISVSRCHAFIKLEKGEFYLDDNNSKFGTLVHLRKAFSVPMDSVDLSLQVGRTVIALTVKRSRKFFSACFSSPDNHNTSNDDAVSESEDVEDGENEQNIEDPISSNRNNASNRQSVRARSEATYVNRRNNPELEDDNIEPGNDGDSGDEQGNGNQPVVEVAPNDVVLGNVVSQNQVEGIQNQALPNNGNNQQQQQQQGQQPAEIRPADNVVHQNVQQNQVLPNRADQEESDDFDGPVD